MLLHQRRPLSADNSLDCMAPMPNCRLPAPTPVLLSPIGGSHLESPPPLGECPRSGPRKGHPSARFPYMRAHNAGGMTHASPTSCGLNWQGVRGSHGRARTFIASLAALTSSHGVGVSSGSKLQAAERCGSSPQRMDTYSIFEPPTGAMNRVGFEVLMVSALVYEFSEFATCSSKSTPLPLPLLAA